VGLVRPGPERLTEKSIVVFLGEERETATRRRHAGMSENTPRSNGTCGGT